MTGGTHLLIVEDEVVLRRCLAAYLEAQGLRVSQAGSITEAAELLDRSEFDAAVLNDDDGIGQRPSVGAVDERTTDEGDDLRQSLLDPIGSGP